MTHLDVDLVSAEDDGNVLADALEVSVPVGHVLVCDLGRDVKHDDAGLPLDVVAVAEPAKLLLPGRVPAVEDDLAKVGVEAVAKKSCGEVSMVAACRIAPCACCLLGWTSGCRTARTGEGAPRHRG